ncbi:class I adenylate-forming enzyme family protein [Actinomycetospora sp. C-140]
MLSGAELQKRAWDGRAPDSLPAWRALRADNLVRTWARSHPHQVAVHFEDRQITFQVLDEMINRAASGCAAVGLRVGDVVGVMAENSPEVLAVLYGLVRAGISALPLNPRHSEREVEFQVADAGAAMVIGPSGTAIEDVMARGVPEPFEIEFDENLFYHLRFTGGTTGTPKCVATTHRAIALLHERLARELGYSRNDVSLVVAPLAHVSFHLAAATLAAGGAISLHRRFDQNRLWEECDRAGVTHALMVPTMLAMALESDSRPHTLKQIVVTSAPFSPSLKARVREKLPSVEVYEMYGASDMGFVSLLVPGDPPEKFASVGRVSFGSEVRILDGEGRDCGPDVVGEIYSRSATHSFGYVGSVPMRADQAIDGWLTVGDLGYFDEDGYLYVVDRREDLIITGGFNVYPAEVEDVILKHGGVDEVAVVGLTDDRWGRVVVAVLRGSANADDLDVLCREHLAHYKVPKRWVHVDALPKTAAMKISRRIIRDQLETDPEATTLS